MSASSHFQHDLLVLSFIFVAAVGIGFGVNALRENPLPLLYRSKEARIGDSVRRIKQLPAASKATPVSLEISLDEFARYVEERKGVTLDARPEIFYRLGHIPRALSMPRDDFERSYLMLREQLEADFAQQIVIYCADASCADATLVKKALDSLGYRNIFIFPGGWCEWTQSGRETEGGQ